MKKILCFIAVLTLVALMATSLTSCNVSDYIDVSGIGGGIFGYDGLLGGSGNGLLGGLGGGIIGGSGNGNGNDEFYADDFMYFPLNDGTYAVYGWSLRYLDRIVIPETHNGRPVTGIVEDAFYGCQMYEIVIPESIQFIGSGAFYECDNLHSITFEGTVEQAQNRFGDGWNYTGGRYVAVYCKDGTIYEPAIENASFEYRYEYCNGEYTEVLVSTNHDPNSTASYTTEATGSGYMNFYYYVSSESGCDKLTVYVNGEEVLQASGMSDYQGFYYYVYYGDSIRFEYSKDSSVDGGDDCARIAHLSFGDRLSESEPTDEPSEEYEYGFTESYVYHNGEDVIEYKSENYHVPSSVAKMEYVLNESGYLEFDYMVSSESGCDTLSVYINDVCVIGASGMNEFYSFSYYVSYGDVIRFEYRKDGSVDNGDDCAYIRNPVIHAEAVSEQEPVEDVEYYDFDAYQKYYIDGYVTEYKSNNGNVPNSVAAMEMFCYRSGYLSFDYKISSESGCDVFRVYVNGDCVFAESGVMTDYSNQQIYVNAFDTIRFEYSKDGSVDGGEDCVYIVNIVSP